MKRLTLTLLAVVSIYTTPAFSDIYWYSRKCSVTRGAPRSKARQGTSRTKKRFRPNFMRRNYLVDVMFR